MNKINSRFRSITLLILVILIVVFAAIQFYRPAIANPSVTAAIQLPANVKAIVKRACYDCHSNETNLRWYDKVAPVYWQVAAHVKDGREVLNFSNWKKMASADQKAKLWEVVNQIVAGAMPLKSYEFIHKDAKLSINDIRVLKAYVLTTSHKNKPGDTALVNIADRQLHRFQHAGLSIGALPTALNGITYIPDYKNWQAISTSDRFDNGTMRVIFGNDVAVKAVKDGHIHPWPNGPIFAKVAWDQIEDKDGDVRTGAFKQVEYMIKDDAKYASTKGWGFARFKTPKMIPYGKTVLFANECINCHRPMKAADFVFTEPIKH